MQGETNDERGMVITVDEEQPIIKVRPQRIMKVKKSKIVAAAAGGINTGIGSGIGLGSSSHGRQSSNGMSYSGITKIKQGKQSFIGSSSVSPKKVRVLRFRVGRIASKALLFNVYSYAFSLCGLIKRMLYSTNIFRMLAI